MSRSTYLIGVPHLPDKLLELGDERSLSRSEALAWQRAMRQITRQIIRRRLQHEAQHGQVPVEVPYGLDPALFERPQPSKF